MLHGQISHYQVVFSSSPVFISSSLSFPFVTVQSSSLVNISGFKPLKERFRFFQKLKLSCSDAGGYFCIIGFVKSRKQTSRWRLESEHLDHRGQSDLTELMKYVIQCCSMWMQYLSEVLYMWVCSCLWSLTLFGLCADRRTILLACLQTCLWPCPTRSTDWTMERRTPGRPSMTSIQLTARWIDTQRTTETHKSGQTPQCWLYNGRRADWSLSSPHCKPHKRRTRVPWDTRPSFSLWAPVAFKPIQLRIGLLT